LANLKDPNQGIPLSELGIGELAKITRYEGSDPVLYRLKELGLTRGTDVLIRRFAPFKDPMELIVRGYHLSLRKKDASRIWVVRDAA